MNAVKSVRSDLDTVLKVMYRPRGESKRVDVADALGFQAYKEINLGDKFKSAVSAMQCCMRIRNQYAHCIWWNDNSGSLAFSNLESLAKSDQRIFDLKSINIRHVQLEILREQLSYFEYVSDFLMWILNEGLRKQGKQALMMPNRPAFRGLPPLCN